MKHKKKALFGHTLRSKESVPIFSRELIESQQQALSKASRFPFMRFMPELEVAFEQFRYQRLRRRIPIIGSAGLILFCVFSILDFFTLPPAVAQISIPLRLFLICPLIGLIMYLGAKRVSPHIFLNVYFCVFLISGAAIVAIIYTADVHDFLLAYDGILLHLVFGYFVMCLPYTMAIVGGVIVSGIYLVMSSQMSLQIEQLASNSIFIIGLNFIGALGCYMQERARRFLFLNQQLVDISKEKDKKEIESKTRLIATASHDLRQPLHAMHLLIDALNVQIQEGEQKEIAKSLDISIKQLSYLLNSLLDISKLNAGIVEAKVETLELASWIENFCHTQRLRFLDAGIDLTYSIDQDIFVNVDTVLMDRIIRNVIENIFTHSAANHVHISCTLNEKCARLSIGDNGKGIPKEDQHVIFNEFHRSNQHTCSGMGLGLNIVKQLAQLQGIVYGLESNIGQGACFWFDIPLSIGQAAPSNKRTIKTLFIQTTPSTYWAEYLKSWGYVLTFLFIDAKKTYTEKASQIEQGITQDTQLLIIDLQGINNAQWGIDTFCQTLQKIAQKKPVLCLSATNSNVNTYFETKGFKCVQGNMRPAKLRLIVQDLCSSY